MKQAWINPKFGLTRLGLKTLDLAGLKTSIQSNPQCVAVNCGRCPTAYGQCSTGRHVDSAVRRGALCTQHISTSDIAAPRVGPDHSGKRCSMDWRAPPGRLM